MNVFLVGFMGSGKTYWALKLSESLNVPCTDLDQVIVEHEGSSIANIFKDKGEAHFRQVEATCLRQLIAPDSSGIQNDGGVSGIVATGGGAPCFHDNMEWMNRHGITVWLNPSVNELAERLKTEMDVRPLLQNLTEKELHEFIAGKLKEREEFYSKAKLEIKNTNIAVVEFVNLILHA